MRQPTQHTIALHGSLLGSIMQAEADAAQARRTIDERTLMKRLGRPDEIAAAIAFLVEDESSYMDRRGARR